MRIAFMGTPDFAVPTLDALAAAGHDIAAVYSQPPRRGGRGKAVRPSPVQRRAEALGIEVRTPESLRGADEQAAFAALALDAAVVAAYGLILPQAILDAPRFGCFNVHASLLPRWRGAAPVQRAILAGDATTGVTIMRMERGLDTGPMLAKVETEVERKTAGELTAELATLGAELIVKVLMGSPAEAGVRDRDLRDWAAAFAGERQDEDGVTYAAKIDKEEARLDFSRTAEEVERQVRAFNPPGAWFEHAGERIRVLAAEPISWNGPGQSSPRFPERSRGTSFEPAVERPSTSLGTAELLPSTVVDDALAIACASGTLCPTLVQRAGRAPMSPAELLRGFAIPPGTRLE